MAGPNMDNKLALLWRENVRKMMDHCDMKASDLTRYTTRSVSTLQSCFGGTTVKAMSSTDTIAQLETGFGLNQGAFSSPNFNPAAAAITPPPASAPAEQLATLNIPIPAHKLRAIMRILNDE